MNVGGDTFISGIGNDVFNGLTSAMGDFGAGDTVDYLHTPGPNGVTVDLTLSGQQNTVSAGVDALFNIENLRGSNFADTLTGTGNSVLEGGAGADALVGQTGGGGDTASYEHADIGVSASLATGGVSGDAAGDSYASIENLRGSSHNDTLTGNEFGNVLEGGAGGDSLDGLGGSDTVSYQHADAGVTASFDPIIANTGDAAGDTYISIENLFGSRFSDDLTGNSENNILDGGFGGDDMLTGGAGADTFHFHGGTVTITDFSTVQNDKIDLWNFTATQVDDFIAASIGNTIDFGNEMVLTLENINNISASGLHSTDFILHP